MNNQNDNINNNSGENMYSNWENNDNSNNVNQNNNSNLNTIPNNTVPNNNGQNNMYTSWNPNTKQTYRPEEKPYIVMTDEEIKVGKRKNKALVYLVYAFFFIIAGFVYYMYQVDKYEFYPVKEEILIANKSKYQVELTPKNERYFDYLNYKYEIEDKNIAEVNEYGEVRAKEVGETNLKVKYKNGFESKIVKIKVENIDVEKIDLKTDNNENVVNDIISIDSYGGSKINTIVNDNENINIDVEYSSSDDEIVSIDEYGNISANSPGIATIYGETEDGVLGETKIEVKETPIEVEKIELEEKNITIKVGGKARINALAKPDNARSKNLTYELDNNNISIDASGNIEGLKVGKTVVKIKSDNNITAYCTVEVLANEIKLEGLNITSGNTNIKINEEKQLNISYIPLNTTEREVIWESSDSSVLSVTNGKIKGLRNGTVTVTVKSKDENISNSCIVVVKEERIEVTGINVNSQSINVKNGSEFSINASVVPSNATDKKLTYKSNNDNVEINNNGLVKAKKAGTSIITISASNGIKIDKEVNIQEATVEASGINLDKDQLSLNINDTITLIATIYPSETTMRNITWTSSNSNVASVTNGKIVAKNSGQATIIAKTSNGKTAMCKVNVSIPVTNIIINGVNELKVGKSTTFKAEIEPSNASDKTIIWSSDNENIATVKNGEVKGIGQGYATITAKSQNGIIVNKVIYVLKEEVLPVSIQINPNTVEIYEGKNTSLAATISPNNTTNKYIKWESSNESIATVDQNGVVYGITSGTTKIVAKTVNGKVAECTVNVLKNIIEAESILLSAERTEINVWDSINISAFVKPDDATNKNVSWSTYNPDIVSINNGVVTGLRSGTATVVAQTSNGKTASCVVLVKDKTIPVDNVSLSKTKVSLLSGGTYNLTNYVSVSPIDATNQNIVWSSSNNNVAVVENGKITAKQAGKATIYATSADGNKSASSTVTVQEGQLEMHFINVMNPNNKSVSAEKSDQIFIKVGNKSLLIDGGDYSTADQVIDYIKNTLKVTKIDYYIGSHNHHDHVGAAGPIIKAFGIKTVYVPAVTTSPDADKTVPYHHENAVFRKMMKDTYENALNTKVRNEQIEAIKKSNLIPVDASKASEGELTVFNVNGLRVLVLGPMNPGVDDGDVTNQNNMRSLILRMEFGNTSYLFPGDAGWVSNDNSPTDKTEAEYFEIAEKIPNILDVDVFKNGHHYSAKSKNLINLITPKYTIMMQGNKCDHLPSSAFLSTLNKVNSTNYYVGIKNDSCKNKPGAGAGTVVLTSNGSKITIKQKKR